MPAHRPLGQSEHPIDRLRKPCLDQGWGLLGPAATDVVDLFDEVRRRRGELPCCPPAQIRGVPLLRVLLEAPAEVLTLPHQHREESLDRNCARLRELREQRLKESACAAVDASGGCKAS